MSFIQVEFKLTPEQIATCKPIQDALKAESRDERGAVLGEFYILEGSWRFGTAKAHHLDSKAAESVRQSIAAALEDSNRRQEQAKRLRSLLEPIGGSVSGDGVAIIERDGRKYEVREMPKETT